MSGNFSSIFDRTKSHCRYSVSHDSCNAWMAVVGSWVWTRIWTIGSEGWGTEYPANSTFELWMRTYWFWGAWCGWYIVVFVATMMIIKVLYNMFPCVCLEQGKRKRNETEENKCSSSRRKQKWEYYILVPSHRPFAVVGKKLRTNPSSITQQRWTIVVHYFVHVKCVYTYMPQCVS